MPRYLNARQARAVRDDLEYAIGKIRIALIADGADPTCFDHEIGLALARAAVRLDLDLLSGASATIERLEAVVAELGAKLEQAKIATGHVERVHRANGAGASLYTSTELRTMHANGEAPHPPDCRCAACRT